MRPKQRIQTAIMIGSIAIITLVLTFLYQQHLGADQIQNRQTRVLNSQNIAYNIYKNQIKIATVHDYEQLTNYLVNRFQSKIISGTGTLHFADTMDIVEGYGEGNAVADTISTYEYIAANADFNISAIQIRNTETEEIYTVPNIKIWEQSLETVKKALIENTTAQSDLLTFDPLVEYSMVNTSLQDVLNGREVIERIMQRASQAYTAIDGDTLETIALKTGFSQKEIKALNMDLNDQAIFIAGSTVEVPTLSYRQQFSKISTFQRYEPVKYDIQYEDADELYTGEEEIVQAGIEGEQLLQLSAKYTPDGQEIILNQATLAITKLPTTQIVRRGTKESPNVGTGKFKWPTKSRRTSTEFGDDFLYGVYRFHSGLDINEGLNADIMAVDNGVVITNEYGSGYGNYIIVDHNNGYYSLYAHLNISHVRVGQIVRQGEVIGGMGSTGLSTGVHLHLEIRKGSNTKQAAQNPKNYLS